jgi:hypothetical protein
MRKVQGSRVDPVGEYYKQFQCERQCKNCKFWKCQPWSIRTGICEVFGGITQRHWECVLDENGKLKVTRQKIVQG